MKFLIIVSLIGEELILIRSTLISSKKLKDLIISLQNESIRKELGTKLQNEIIEKFNAEIEIKKLVKVYKENMD